MEQEPNFFPKKEQPITNLDDFVALLKLEITKFTADILDQPQGDDKTTLREFLTNKTEGSEWTDPLGFKVRIEEGAYILE